ncbi:TetR/AcrR family transcriptional regulator [Streptomyces sp. NPDC046985]|uniref:TetR/AcrR family transcriptional regulator n=1 Tax=Streptomyces sp. NPDC046985 TaxID=3155377 RepID=UPI0034001B03
MSGRKQFDVDTALEAVMVTFWRLGYADTSLDVIGRATGLGRGSLYGTFGGKDVLFRLALARYARTWGDQYDRALAGHPDDAVAAVRAYFEVIVDRLTDPTVPDGCLVAQSASQSASLSPESAAAVRDLLDRQCERIRAALEPSGLPSDVLHDLALFVCATNQSLTVLSRAGFSEPELRSVARTATTAVSNALAEGLSGVGEPARR